MSSTTGKISKVVSRQENTYRHFSFRFTSSKVPQFPELYNEIFSLSDFFAFQLEEGTKSGQQHYQGCFGFKATKKRVTAMRDHFKALFPELNFPNCDYLMQSYVEAGRASERYCLKEDTRIEGPWTSGLPKDHTTVLKKELAIVDTNRKVWQTDILNLLKQEPNRQIYWYWESEGNVGKSVFIKYLSFYHEVQKIGGRCHDIYLTAGKKEHYVIDIPRAVDRLSDAHYIAIEELKNGHVFSSKYECEEKLFPIPHVFIFANFEPDLYALSKLSKDRWVILELTSA